MFFGAFARCGVFSSWLDRRHQDRRFEVPLQQGAGLACTLQSAMDCMDVGPVGLFWNHGVHLGSFFLELRKHTKKTRDSLDFHAAGRHSCSLVAGTKRSKLLGEIFIKFLKKIIQRAID